MALFALIHNQNTGDKEKVKKTVWGKQWLGRG